MKIKVKLDEGAYMPERAHDTDAGLDLRTPKDLYVSSDGWAFVDTGVHIALPPGTVGLIKSKSGLLARHNIVVDGLIDEGYTGSIYIKVFNRGFCSHCFFAGDKIAQLVIVPCVKGELEQVDELPQTERGGKGFGSTGR